jgi:NADH dehydrogenase
MALGAGRSPRPPFKYWDKGTMATIGRSAAVAWVGKFKFTGLLAWLAWLFIHLIFLVGFRNKIAVMIQWAYSYFAYKRSARIITYLPLEVASTPHSVESPPQPFNAKAQRSEDAKAVNPK